MSTSRQPLPPPSPSPPLPPLSSWSSHGIPSSCFYSGDFMLGAGMLIIQPETGRVVVIHHPPSGEWFLPKGRKDIGESLEQAAVREAHEETGYRAELLPFFQEHHQPAPEGSPHRRNYLPTTEPFYIDISTSPARPARGFRPASMGNEYLQFFWLGCIPADAVPDANTQMADETNYVAHLLEPEDAFAKMKGTAHEVVTKIGWMAWQKSLRIEEQIWQLEERKRVEAAPEGVSHEDAPSGTILSGF